MAGPAAVSAQSRMMLWTAPTLRHRCAKGGCVEAHHIEGEPFGFLAMLHALRSCAWPHCKAISKPRAPLHRPKSSRVGC